MSRALEMSVTNGNRLTTKYPSTSSPCPTKEKTAPEWEFWDLQSQPHTLPLLQVASSQIQLDSSFRASPESPSSAQNTKIGLLISPAMSSLLHIPIFPKAPVLPEGKSCGLQNKDSERPE